MSSCFIESKISRVPVPLVIKRYCCSTALHYQNPYPRLVSLNTVYMLHFVDVVAAVVHSVCARASLVPRLSHSLLWARGTKRESLVHIVCTCTNYLSYHACRHYSRKYTGVSIMGVYKNTEIPKNVLENLRMCCSTHYCKRLFTWSKTSGNIINTMLQSVLSLWSMT